MNNEYKETTHNGNGCKHKITHALLPLGNLWTITTLNLVDDGFNEGNLSIEVKKFYNYEEAKQYYDMLM